MEDTLRANVEKMNENLAPPWVALPKCKLWDCTYRIPGYGLQGGGVKQ
jgi:hypothetical protein